MPTLPAGGRARRVRRIDLAPLGAVDLVATTMGVCRVVFSAWGESRVPAGPDTSSSGALSQLTYLDQAEAFLHAWRQARSGVRPPPLPVLDLSGVSDFTRRVLEVTATIGCGDTLSYGEVAGRLGQRGAARAVGQALGRNPLPILIPCHRVLGARTLGGFTPGIAIKRLLLEVELVQERHVASRQV